MPSLSFLKRSRAPSHLDNGRDGRMENAHHLWHSRRDFFRSVLSLSGASIVTKPSREALRRGSRHLAASPLPLQIQVSSLDKPLPPPPPPPMSDPKDTPSLRTAVLKMDRIITPVAVDGLHKIFSGAPQFFARAEGHNTGAPHPSVCFPWDQEVHIRDLTDHWKIHDEAWGCITAWPHVTVQSSRDPFATEEDRVPQRAHFQLRCRERPNMLSMHGIEKGTMGFQAALEMGVADALDLPVEGLDVSPETVAQHRRQYLCGKTGLRPISETVLLDRLQDASKAYHQDPKKHRKSHELYSELFTAILFPPSRITDNKDPYSLPIQIEALIDVLAEPTVWVDFSLVEWRIRLGQILWGVTLDLNQEDGVSVNNETARDPGTERYWLLVQILLSCELLLRLDEISMQLDRGEQATTPSEIHRFETLTTSSIKWSLMLARAWMENIDIERSVVAAVDKKSGGWLSTFTAAPSPEAEMADTLQNARFRGRHESRQLSGLLHFARNLHWPDLEILEGKAATHEITISDSVPSTPMGPPLTVSLRQSTYCATKRPPMNRGRSLHKHVSTMIQGSGWLSNSYLTGLVLPGEGLSHFLISTLLENDPKAVSRLGEQANLYGGFIYHGKSYWSSACVVGRVLAAGEGASECMGWVYSQVLPRGAKEGWVDIDVEPDMSAALPKYENHKPRLWRKNEVEKDGHIIGGAEISSVLPGDFVLPSDGSMNSAMSVRLESLDLFNFESTVPPTTDEKPTSPFSQLSFAPVMKTYSAMMRFTIETDGKPSREVNVALNHEVYFVTAHPCIPSSHVEILGPSLLLSDGTGKLRKELGEGGFCDAHPLHKNFAFTKRSLSSLLDAIPQARSLDNLIGAGPKSPRTPASTTQHEYPRVLIIDCTAVSTDSLPIVGSMNASPHSGMKGIEREKRAKDGSDLEMLARAVCSERGWDAVISRRGRGCLACAVREAGALGWRVVLRVG